AAPAPRVIEREPSFGSSGVGDGPLGVGLGHAVSTRRSRSSHRHFFSIFGARHDFAEPNSDFYMTLNSILSVENQILGPKNRIFHGILGLPCSETRMGTAQT